MHLLQFCCGGTHAQRFFAILVAVVDICVACSFVAVDAHFVVVVFVVVVTVHSSAFAVLKVILNDSSGNLLLGKKKRQINKFNNRTPL